MLTSFLAAPEHLILRLSLAAGPCSAVAGSATSGRLIAGHGIRQLLDSGLPDKVTAGRSLKLDQQTWEPRGREATILSQRGAWLDLFSGLCSTSKMHLSDSDKGGLGFLVIDGR